MAEFSVREPIISDKDDKNSIIKNSLRDTEIGTSAFDIQYDPDSAHRQFIRQQAKHHINRVIEDKLDDSKFVEVTDSIEEALQRIARERQQEREQYRALNQTGSKRKKKRKKDMPVLTAVVEVDETSDSIETKVETVQVSSTIETAVDAVEVPNTVDAADVATATEVTETEVTDKIAETGEDSTTTKSAEITEVFTAAGSAEIVETPDNRLDLYMDRILSRMQTCLRFIMSFVLTIGNRIAYRALIKAAPLIKVLVKRAKLKANRIRAAQARLSDKMAAAVDRTDGFVDKLFDRGERYLNAFIKKQRQARDWCEAHKRLLLGSVAGMAVVAASVSLVIGHITAYEYMYNDKVLGIVKNQKDVYDIIDTIGDKLTYAYGAEITIDKEKDISFRKVMGFDLKLDGKEDILNQFTYLRDMNATAYAIVAGGQQKAILYSKKCAEKILKDIQNTYVQGSDSVEYESIGFKEKVEIVEVDTKIGNIQDEEKVLEYMLTGAVEKKTYAVKSGDTLSGIAKKLGISMDDLAAANPDVDPTRLQIGQELTLTRPCPVLTVQTTEIAEYKVPIDYDIVYEETSALYKGEQTVKSAGVKGERLVVARIVRNNGEEVSRQELSTTILSEPKSQVVLKGTKDLPPLIGTGKFIYPVRGARLTSRFGYRWGRMHNGIDLAASTGTKIRAADGGKVISAGWEGALGYCVRIDHGQNKVTVYGHCSKIFVKKGDRVYKDQHIANVGNTGRSTGPHLHFEIHVNGVPQNPLKYLP